VARKLKGTLVTVKQRPLLCLVCEGKLFHDKEITVGSRHGSVIGLECMDCGYLHTFMDGGKVDMFRADFGYPGQNTAE
jgi:hypothetical protein